jgi:hypothetical protein
MREDDMAEHVSRMEYVANAYKILTEIIGSEGTTISQSKE